MNTEQSLVTAIKIVAGIVDPLPGDERVSNLAKSLRDMTVSSRKGGRYVARRMTSYQYKHVQQYLPW